MIILYHANSKVTAVISSEKGELPGRRRKNAVSVLLDLATEFKEEVLVWCHENERENLNIPFVVQRLHHQKLLISYHPFDCNFFDNRLGYIEDTHYINIDKKVSYATWQISGQVGAVHASVIHVCRQDLNPEKNFDYFLNSLGKRLLPLGIFCYSEPSLLLKQNTVGPTPKASLSELFKFTKQHYRTRWVFLLFFNLFLYEKQFAIIPLLISLFYRKRKLNPEKLNAIPLKSNRKIVASGTIDVLIPTIGRKGYLHDVLNHLTNQTQLPKNVIIIEQNPLEGSTSELDFLQNQAWPFNIKHQFTHQSGACNARNMGLALVESEFTFFADDDIVFESDLLEKALQAFQDTGNEALLVACHLPAEKIIPQPPKQSPFFGAGHAFVKSDCFRGLSFNMAYEFGFGEDNDFGMELRHRGFDVLYITTSKILHLKAPMGGFRTRPILQWQNDDIQPKPSPTVMFYKLKYDTKEQLRSYKTTLFFKNWDKSFFRNPFLYVKMFQKKWNRSVFWANELKQS
ncbi:glycosyltransferase family 2 protein [Flavobacterium sp. XGLA_31]|uniref:glycosyltransferase family 2 protein n=1 Tax=Flavobacterium sp. XGLA_31 TaxID=3447666 RepID=UPI003F4059C6